MSGAGSPQQSGSPPTTSQRGSARRDFEGRERELMEEASSSDASSQPEAVASPRSSEIHTHAHTRKLTTQQYHVFLLHFVSPSLCTAYTTPSFPFSLPPRTGPHRHPCAVRAISAASGHSNKHQQRSTAEACVCQRQRFPRLRSACLVSAQRACARVSQPCPPVRVNYLPACCSLLALLLACLLAQLLLLLLLSVDVHHHCRPQWTRGRHASSQPLPLACLLAYSSLHCLSACVTALPCLALLDRTCRARESTLTTAFRPALPHPVSHSVSCTKTHLSCLPRSTDRPGSDFSTTSPESSARSRRP